MKMLTTRDTWLTRRLALILLLLFTMTFVSPLVICATSLDELQQQSQEQETGSDETVPDGMYRGEDGQLYYQGQEPAGSNQPGNAVESQGSNAIADYMRGYTPVTEENMQFATETMSPLVKVIGNITGCIMVFTVAAIFLVTALDLCYIGVPFTRAFLNPQYASGVQAGGMPMGGMGMGMRGYGGMGGMGMMGGNGAQQNMPEAGLRRKWVSDEAVAIVAQYAAQPIGQNSAMGMGSPMGGMMGGMMGGGMMGGMNQPVPPAPTKIVIFEYFKRRVIFLVIFAVASTLLLSSVFTDCGLNIAELGVKLMNKLNGKITEVNI